MDKGLDVRQRHAWTDRQAGGSRDGWVCRFVDLCVGGSRETMGYNASRSGDAWVHVCLKGQLSPSQFQLLNCMTTVAL